MSCLLCCVHVTCKELKISSSKMKPNMNNHIGSAQGQAGAVMHFLLRLPWKLPRLCMCRPAGACCHCVWPGCRVCGWCISLIIRGSLKARKQKASFAAIRTERWSKECQAVGWDWEPNGSDTKSHRETQHSANTHMPHWLYVPECGWRKRQNIEWQGALTLASWLTDLN